MNIGDTTTKPITSVRKGGAIEEHTWTMRVVGHETIGETRWAYGLIVESTDPLEPHLNTVAAIRPDAH